MNGQQKTKKQLLEDLQRERERSIALQEVSNNVVAAHDTDEVLDLIVNEAVRLIGASAATLRLLEGNRLVPRAATDSATAHLAVAAEIKEAYIAEDSSSIMGRVLATKKPYLTEDAQNDPLLTSEAARQNLQRSGFHAGVNIPLLVNDQAIGVLVVFDKRIHQWAEDEVSLLSAFADQAALALEKARLLNEAEREKERSDALYQVSNRLAGVHDTDDRLQRVAARRSGRLGERGIRGRPGADQRRGQTPAGPDQRCPRHLKDRGRRHGYLSGDVPNHAHDSRRGYDHAASGAKEFQFVGGRLPRLCWLHPRGHHQSPARPVQPPQQRQQVHRTGHDLTHYQPGDHRRPGLDQLALWPTPESA